ncbi:MAG: RNA-directed DNA polymerase [Polyangiales bacterium]|jgi:RNA-directed DNA polymerase
MKIAIVISAGVALVFALLAWRAAMRRRNRFVPRFGIDVLAERLEMEPDALRRFTPSYQVHAIDKRGPYRSSREKRTLHIPSGYTMGLQRKILVRILRDLKAHPAALGFEKGTSTALNASAHTRQAVVLKMDVIDFFRSTRSERIQDYFRSIGWDEESAEILTRVTTHEGGLPQGAPTSPALSNRVNFLLDVEITQRAGYRRATYTRYADDITVSFPNDSGGSVRGMEQAVRRAARRHGYRVHKRKKLRVLRSHQSQQVTGLVVNEGPRLPRKTRRWLRAVEHRLKTGGAATLTQEQLDGWKAYKADVDGVRTRKEQELRDSITAALRKNQGSLTATASQLRMPLRALKRHMKALGLWKPPSRKSPRGKTSV